MLATSAAWSPNSRRLRGCRRRSAASSTGSCPARTLASVGGTVAACEDALEDGWGGNLAGGTHHAFPEHGSGFCIFNDCAVAARVLLEEGAVQQLMVIDLDVHQGDATAAIFADEPRVFTVSAHCASNFPLHKQQSDVDIPLADGLGDVDYLVAVGDRIPELLDQVKPQLVLYNAGVDPHHGDRLGRLKIGRAHV